jgi:hypothetical protein
MKRAYLLYYSLPGLSILVLSGLLKANFEVGAELRPRLWYAFLVAWQFHFNNFETRALNLWRCAAESTDEAYADARLM